ncbi:PRTRC system protein B [Tenacibaculum sp. MAR_2009_124]|uniref:hypothetical protein n=1 Tax=Tenacibaculum sp. MAR_2009_124 TaxID=1250059 RepID=UPI000894CE52|nr:hypothetical protein [Tenacibaculum sp. MAR_2009_124]SEC67903.1 PRTRC system protein B [Tenacibaculum sp. MAR_2009_124]
MFALSNIRERDNLIPTFAIIGYISDKQNNLVTYHTIQKDKLSSGEPLTKETANGIFGALKAELQPYSFKGIIPRNVLHFNMKVNLELTWICNPKVKKLYFAEDTDIKSKSYPIPKLIFRLIGKTISVFAIKSNDPINENTQVYFSPFLNVDNNGNVCMGDTSLNYQNFEHYEEIMQFIENQFFCSMFTHIHNSNMLNKNVVLAYKEHENKKKFNEQLLVESPFKIHHIYEN